jgi:hypothetical protein
MTIDEIEEAKINPNKLRELYKKLFYENGNPKLRYWLIKKGVSYNEVDDVESSMNELFMEGVMKYNNDKIDFEKWMWIKFKQQLSNYYSNKKLKKNADLIFEHDIEKNEEDRIDESFYDKIKFDIGNVSDVTFDIDENIPHFMNNLQRFIYRCKVYANFRDDEIFEVANFLTDNRKEFQNEVVNIRKIIKKYIDGEL